MKLKLIATGKALEEEKKYIVASVYAELDETGAEKEGGELHVALKYGELEAEAALTAPLDVKDMISGAGAVPGYDGHDEVTLPDPVEIKYAKTRVVPNGEKFAVYGTARYIASAAKPVPPAPKRYEITNATVEEGGSDYQEADELTIGSGGGTVKVDSVDEGGQITAVSVSNKGEYESDQSGQISPTGGNGTGAKLNITMSEKAID